VLTHLMEGIGSRWMSAGDRMFVDRFRWLALFRQARRLGRAQLSIPQGNVTGIAYAEI